MIYFMVRYHTPATLATVKSSGSGCGVSVKKATKMFRALVAPQFLVKSEEYMLQGLKSLLKSTRSDNC